LWEWKYNGERLKRIKKKLGTYFWSALYMDSPQQYGGNLFKTKHFRYYSVEPLTGDYLCYRAGGGDPLRVPRKTLRRRENFIDPALESGLGNDPTGQLAWAYCTKNKVWILLDRFNDRVEHTLIIDTIVNFAAKNGCTRNRVENEKIGKILVKTSVGRDKLDKARIPFVELEMGNIDKYTRAIPMASYVENERVFFPLNAPWLKDYESSLTAFPFGKHDEDVDCTSYAADMEDETSTVEQLASGDGWAAVRSIFM